MKARINYKSKKMIVIATATTIMLAGAIIATTAFINGNQNVSVDANQRIQMTNIEENTLQVNRIDEQGNQKENLQMEENYEVNTNRTTTFTTNENVPNKEYTQTTAIPKRKTNDETYISWDEIEVTGASDSAVLPNYTINKNVRVVNSESEENISNINIKRNEHQINQAVQTGQELEYAISIKNNSDKDEKGINISDNIPEGTILVENSYGNGEYDKNLNKISWKVDVLKGKTVTVLFKVKVITTNNITIKNIATVNGKDTPETITPIIKSNKSSIVLDKEGIKKDEKIARVGETIEYTIKVENQTDINAKTVIVDSDLRNILKDGKAELIGDINVLNNDKNEEKISLETLSTGYNVEIQANSILKIVYKVKVNKITGDILNKAVVGNKNTKIDKVETVGLEVNKQSTIYEKAEGNILKDKVEIGDKIQYIINVRNTGSATLKDVLIKDEIMKNENNEEVSKIIEELEPSTEFIEAVKFIHVVNEKDITLGKDGKVYVYNKAFAVAKDPTDREIIDEDENIIDANENYKYKVEYYFEKAGGEFAQDENIKASNEKNAKYLSKIGENDIDMPEKISGYTLDTTLTETTSENLKLPLIIKANNNSNIIRLYYVRNKFDYEIRYYKDTITDINSNNYLGNITDTAFFEETIEADVTKYLPTGYEFAGEEIPSMIIRLDNNIINVVYTPKTNISYTVKYYFNEEEDESKEYSETGRFNEVINAKDYSNNGEWELAPTSTLEFTIDTNENIFRVYYIKPNVTVNKVSKPSVKREDGTVMINEEIEYTITAINTGYKEGIVKIADEIPKGTKLKEESIKATGVMELDEEKLKNGITLKVPAKENNIDGTATISFAVIVVEKPGTVIKNYATINDNEKTNETENKVEKTITITEKTESIKATNIVLVIDTSGSMENITSDNEGDMVPRCKKENCNRTHREDWAPIVGNYKYHTRMTTAIDAACRFIDQIYPNTGTNNGTTISVIEFNSKATVIGNIANSYSTAQNLKSKIKEMNGKGNTAMGKALNLANSKLTEVSSIYKNNNNVVVFLSDGSPTDETAYKKAAQTLKTGANKANIYTIGFEIKSENSDSAKVLKEIASNTSQAYLSNIERLFSTFDDISSNISKNTINKISAQGKVKLKGIYADSKHPIIININGKDTTITEIPTSNIILENGNYYLDLTKFEATDSIKIEYYSK